MEEKIFENDYFTLTDEDGNEIEFELIGRCELNGQQYFAMIPVEEIKNSLRNRNAAKIITDSAVAVAPETED